MTRLRALMSTSIAKAFKRSFVASFLSRFAQVAMSVLAARLLAPEGFGIFTFATGLALLGGRIGSMGWPTLMQRFIPRYDLAQDWAMLRGLVRAANLLMAGTALIVGAGLIAIAYALGPQHELFSGFLLGGVLLPVMSYRALYRNLLAALKAPQLGIMVDEMIPALGMTLVLLVPFLLPYKFISTPLQATLVYFAASAVAVFFGYYWLGRNLPTPARDARPSYALRMWILTALPAMVGMSAKLLMNKSDVLMLAPLSNLAEVGYYGAALRLTYIQTAPVIVLSTVLTSRIAEAISAGRPKQAQRLLLWSMVFAAAVSLPFALALGVFPTPILTILYGADFAPAAGALVWLSIGQVGAALNISTSAFMLMAGRQVRFGQLTTFGLVLNVALNWFLIPGMGAMGSALATAISIWVLTGLQGIACAAIIRSGRYGEKTKVPTATGDE